MLDAHTKLVVEVIEYAIKQERLKLDANPTDAISNRSKIKDRIKKMKKAIKYSKEK